MENVVNGKERTARIFNIQKYSIYDGPGIRTLIFFKGCPLRCKWCSNPEGLEYKHSLMFQKDMCVNCGICAEVCPVGIHQMDANGQHYIDRSKDCIGCKKCEMSCPRTALSVAGSEYTVNELVDIVMEDSSFYYSSGGGVTLGGGEVTSQPTFAMNLLHECKNKGVHTAIETCGYANPSVYQSIEPYVDLFLYDMKCIDSKTHQALTGVPNELILENLDFLIKNGNNVIVRMPIIKGYNDSKILLKAAMQYLDRYKDYDNLLEINLLPYHKLGVNKYRQLDMTYPIPDDIDYTDEELNAIENLIKENTNRKIRLIKH